MRIAYVENVRLPTEKAHGYQIMKTCEALVEAGVQVQLFVAERRNSIGANVFEYYKVPKVFDVFRLPVVDVMDIIKPLNVLAYPLERASFIRSVKRSRLALLASDIWYTRDVKTAEALVCLPNARPVFVELHDATYINISEMAVDQFHGMGTLASRVAGWITISQGVKDALVRQGVSEEKIMVAHDGFDPEMFANLLSRGEARAKLGVDPKKFLLVYTGHLYPWKGVDGIAPAFKQIPSDVELVIVGGYPKDIERVKSIAGNTNVRFVGQQSREVVATWLAAADAAFLPTSAKFEIGKTFTSPLKLFEYLAAGLPILASDVPSSHEILDESVATFFKADDAGDFLKKLDEMRGRSWSSEKSKEKVKPYRWSERGQHISKFVAALPSASPRNDTGVFIVTQAVDESDTNLAFFLSWITELATKVPVVHVAAWKVGKHQLPANVKVYQMPKGKWKRIFALMRLSISIRKDVEVVFVHMLAPVAAVLGWYWRLLALRVVLWYTHGSVPMSLRVTNIWVDAICTATDESLRLKTIKRIVTGHGIDTGRLRPGSEPRLPELITVGRISPRKRLESLLDLVEAIRRAHPSLHFRLRIIGDAYLDSDKVYEEVLKSEVIARGLSDIVSFDGAKLGNEWLTAYQRAAVFVTASETGSLDKVVLESLSCGTPVLAASSVFAGFKGVHVANQGWDDDAVAFVASRLARPMTDEGARDDVGVKASLKALISRLVSILLD